MTVEIDALKYDRSYSSHMALEERVKATGHENVSAEHESTLELTTDDFLTPAGDCILGIDADRSPADFDPAFVEACQDDAATIRATLEVGGHQETITGKGHPGLTFQNERSLVCRTSNYLDDRTVMIDADRAAAGLDRDLVDALAEGEDVILRLEVE